MFLLGCLPFLYAQKPKIVPLAKVKGNQFVDSQGKPMVFRGLALSDPDKLFRAGHWDENYFRRAHEWGANVVRIPVHPDRWRMRGEKGYLELLDMGVDWAKKYQMLVILDWHVIGNLKTELFQDAIYDTTQRETYKFWQGIAAHYRDEPWVAFYELFNEPTTFNEQLGDWSWAEWMTQAETIIKIIPANNPIAIPLVGGLDWDYDLTPMGDNPINSLASVTRFIRILKSGLNSGKRNGKKILATWLKNIPSSPPSLASNARALNAVSARPSMGVI